MMPFLGWLPLNIAKRAIGCTMQLAIGYLISIPFRQHHKSRTPKLNVQKLTDVIAVGLKKEQPTLSFSNDCAI